MAIRTFKNKATCDIAREIRSKIARKRLPEFLHESAYRKLVFLDNAHSLGDLMEWRSLHLEKLKGDRKDQYSIRINDQYRICFRWSGTEAVDVEIVDYH
ncbi:MAG TPA: plasmid maintenance system killer protein [Planctomycetes bacterium]|nr:plasmid maintenance system killer protein [Planctomycetota bacterium]